MNDLSIPEENPGRSGVPLSLSFHLQIENPDDFPDDSMNIPDERRDGIGPGRLVGINPNSNEAVMRKVEQTRELVETPRRLDQNITSIVQEPQDRPFPAPAYVEKPKVQMQVQIAFTPVASAGLRENWLPLLPLRLEKIYSRVEEIFPYLHFLGPPAIELPKDSEIQAQTWYAHSAPDSLSAVFTQQKFTGGNSGAFYIESTKNRNLGTVSTISVTLELPTDKRSIAEMMDAMQTLETRIRAVAAKRPVFCSVIGNQDLRKARQPNQAVLRVDGDRLLQTIESASDITNPALVSKIIAILQQA